MHTYTCTRGHLGFWNIRNQRRPHCFPVHIYDCKFNTGKVKKGTYDDFLCNKINTSDSVKHEEVACYKRENNWINLVISTYVPTSSWLLSHKKYLHPQKWMHYIFEMLQLYRFIKEYSFENIINVLTCSFSLIYLGTPNFHNTCVPE